MDYPQAQALSPAAQHPEGELSLKTSIESAANGAVENQHLLSSSDISIKAAEEAPGADVEVHNDSINPEVPTMDKHSAAEATHDGHGAATQLTSNSLPVVDVGSLAGEPAHIQGERAVSHLSQAQHTAVTKEGVPHMHTYTAERAERTRTTSANSISNPLLNSSAASSLVSTPSGSTTSEYPPVLPTLDFKAEEIFRLPGEHTMAMADSTLKNFRIYLPTENSNTTNTTTTTTTTVSSTEVGTPSNVQTHLSTPASASTSRAILHGDRLGMDFEHETGPYHDDTQDKIRSASEHSKILATGITIPGPNVSTVVPRNSGSAMETPLSGSCKSQDFHKSMGKVHSSVHAVLHTEEIARVSPTNSSSIISPSHSSPGTNTIVSPLSGSSGVTSSHGANVFLTTAVEPMGDMSTTRYPQPQSLNPEKAEISSFGPVINWTPNQVSTWLSLQGFGKYSTVFTRNKISGLVLMHMNTNVLADIGVNSSTDRSKIISEIKDISKVTAVNTVAEIKTSTLAASLSKELPVLTPRQGNKKLQLRKEAKLSILTKDINEDTAIETQLSSSPKTVTQSPFSSEPIQKPVYRRIPWPRVAQMKKVSLRGPRNAPFSMEPFIYHRPYMGSAKTVSPTSSVSEFFTSSNPGSMHNSSNLSTPRSPNMSFIDPSDGNENVENMISPSSSGKHTPAQTLRTFFGLRTRSGSITTGQKVESNMESVDIESKRTSVGGSTDVQSTHSRHPSDSILSSSLNSSNDAKSFSDYYLTSAQLEMMGDPATPTGNNVTSPSSTAAAMALAGQIKRYPQNKKSLHKRNKSSGSASLLQGKNAFWSPSGSLSSTGPAMLSMMFGRKDARSPSSHRGIQSADTLSSNTAGSLNGSPSREPYLQTPQTLATRSGDDVSEGDMLNKTTEHLSNISYIPPMDSIPDDVEDSINSKLIEGTESDTLVVENDPASEITRVKVSSLEDKENSLVSRPASVHDEEEVIDRAEMTPVNSTYPVLDSEEPVKVEEKKGTRSPPKVTNDTSPPPLSRRRPYASGRAARPPLLVIETNKNASKANRVDTVKSKNGIDYKPLVSPGWIQIYDSNADVMHVVQFPANSMVETESGLMSSSSKDSRILDDIMDRIYTRFGIPIDQRDNYTIFGMKKKQIMIGQGNRNGLHPLSADELLDLVSMDSLSSKQSAGLPSALTSSTSTASASSIEEEKAWFGKARRCLVLARKDKPLAADCVRHIMYTANATPSSPIPLIQDPVQKFAASEFNPFSRKDSLKRVESTPVVSSPLTSAFNSESILIPVMDADGANETTMISRPSNVIKGARSPQEDDELHELPNIGEKTDGHTAKDPRIIRIKTAFKDKSPDAEHTPDSNMTSPMEGNDSSATASTVCSPLSAMSLSDRPLVQEPESLLFESGSTNDSETIAKIMREKIGKLAKDNHNANETIIRRDIQKKTSLRSKSQEHPVIMTTMPEDETIIKESISVEPLSAISSAESLKLNDSVGISVTTPNGTTKKPTDKMMLPSPLVGKSSDIPMTKSISASASSSSSSTSSTTRNAFANQSRGGIANTRRDIHRPSSHSHLAHEYGQHPLRSNQSLSNMRRPGEFNMEEGLPSDHNSSDSLSGRNMNRNGAFHRLPSQGVHNHGNPYRLRLFGDRSLHDVINRRPQSLYDVQTNGFGGASYEASQPHPLRNQQFSQLQSSDSGSDFISYNDVNNNNHPSQIDSAELMASSTSTSEKTDPRGKKQTVHKRMMSTGTQPYGNLDGFGNDIHNGNSHRRSSSRAMSVASMTNSQYSHSRNSSVQHLKPHIETDRPSSWLILENLKEFFPASNPELANALEHKISQRLVTNEHRRLSISSFASDGSFNSGKVHAGANTPASLSRRTTTIEILDHESYHRKLEELHSGGTTPNESANTSPNLPSVTLISPVRLTDVIAETHDESYFTVVPGDSSTLDDDTTRTDNKDALTVESADEISGSSTSNTQTWKKPYPVDSTFYNGITQKRHSADNNTVYREGSFVSKDGSSDFSKSTRGLTHKDTMNSGSTTRPTNVYDIECVDLFEETPIRLANGGYVERKFNHSSNGGRNPSDGGISSDVEDMVVARERVRRSFVGDDETLKEQSSGSMTSSKRKSGQSTALDKHSTRRGSSPVSLGSIYAGMHRRSASRSSILSLLLPSELNSNGDTLTVGSTGTMNKRHSHDTIRHMMSHSNTTSSDSTVVEKRRRKHNKRSSQHSKRSSTQTHDLMVSGGHRRHRDNPSSRMSVSSSNNGSTFIKRSFSEESIAHTQGYESDEADDELENNIGTVYINGRKDSFVSLNSGSNSTSNSISENASGSLSVDQHQPKASSNAYTKNLNTLRKMFSATGLVSANPSREGSSMTSYSRSSLPFMHESNSNMWMSNKGNSSQNVINNMMNDGKFASRTSSPYGNRISRPLMGPRKLPHIPVTEKDAGNNSNHNVGTAPPVQDATNRNNQGLFAPSMNRNESANSASTSIRTIRSFGTNMSRDASATSMASNENVSNAHSRAPAHPRQAHDKKGSHTSHPQQHLDENGVPQWATEMNRLSTLESQVETTFDNVKPEDMAKSSTSFEGSKTSLSISTNFNQGRFQIDDTDDDEEGGLHMTPTSVHIHQSNDDMMQTANDENMQPDLSDDKPEEKQDNSMLNMKTSYAPQDRLMLERKDTAHTDTPTLNRFDTAVSTMSTASETSSTLSAVSPTFDNLDYSIPMHPHAIKAREEERIALTLRYHPEMLLRNQTNKRKDSATSASSSDSKGLHSRGSTSEQVVPPPLPRRPKGHPSFTDSINSAPANQQPQQLQQHQRQSSFSTLSSHGFSTELLGDVQIQNWVQGPLIGHGSFGKVYYGVNLDTGDIMAVKQVRIPRRFSLLRHALEDEAPSSMTGIPQVPTTPRKDMRKKMVDSLLGEIRLLRELDHPNIVRYLGYEVRPSENINVFLEYVSGGSVASTLASRGRFSEDLVVNITGQVLKGLEYLHDRFIIHRDIKGGNILLDEHGTAKISDFGISKKSARMAYRFNSQMSVLAGSVHWMAPEVVLAKGYSAKVDIWSLGCLIVEMLTATSPWRMLDEMQTVWKLGHGNRPFLPQNLQQNLHHALELCLMTDPELRPTAKELQVFFPIMPDFVFNDACLLGFSTDEDEDDDDDDDDYDSATADNAELGQDTDLVNMDLDTLVTSSTTTTTTTMQISQTETDAIVP